LNRRVSNPKGHWELWPSTNMNRASLVIVLLFLLLAAGCASTDMPGQSTARDQAPPISMLPPDTANLNYYYPDASRRAKEVGQVIARLTIGANGIAEEPIDIDTERSSSYPRLLDATRKIFRRKQFAIGDGYSRTVAASVVFEIEPCGNIPHAKDVNFYFDVCIPPL
jgi:Gram-negative bacterial TonB protein C-terminal